MVRTWTKTVGLTGGLVAMALTGCNGDDIKEGSGSATVSTATDSDTATGSATMSTASESGNSATGTSNGGSESNSASGTTVGTITASASASATGTSDTSQTTGETDSGLTGTSDGPTTGTTGVGTIGTNTTDEPTGTSDSMGTGSSTGDDTTGGSTGDMEPPCGSQLKATIRDFKVDHPDMQSYCCGLVKDLVQDKLGNDDKPAFNSPGNPKMLTDGPTYDQWYNDVDGVNQSVNITLDLMEIMPGVFSYQSDAFFPVDDQLFGNQGNNHNFHFTTEIHTSFQYSGGETFTFQGDDDVWVFINKELAIDLGGVHGVAMGTVNLDDFGLTVGNIYPLDVFHAERHTVESNFRIDTTICAVPQ